MSPAGSRALLNTERDPSLISRLNLTDFGSFASQPFDIFGRVRTVLPGTFNVAMLSPRFLVNVLVRLSKVSVMVGVHLIGGWFFCQEASPPGLVSSPLSVTFD